MKLVFLTLAVFCFSAFADTAQNPAETAPKVTQALPVTQPPTPVITALPGTPSGPVVAVAEASAPPAWAQKLITTAESLPVVGPVVAKLLVYLGILSSILTVLVSALLTILGTLLGVFNMSGLSEAATAIAAFRDGKIMYWLKFFSLFNAKKETPK